MTIKTTIKAGIGCPVWGCGVNHNETALRERSLRIKTSVKAGAVTFNHNETQSSERSA